MADPEVVTVVQYQLGTVSELVEREWRPGVSTGAAARQVCRSLDPGTPLRRLLEELLADANRASRERYRILEDASAVYPRFGQFLALRSYRRINGIPAE